MKIVRLANFYSPTSGGLRTVVDTLGRGYVASGHERVLVVPGAHRARAATDAGLAVEVNDKTTLLAVADWARDRGHRTVLVSHERLDRWIEARVPRLWRAGAGRVLTPAVRGWNKGLAHRFDTVVVTSAYAEREFAGLPVPLRRIPLGVDLTTFRPHTTGGSRGPARLV